MRIVENLNDGWRFKKGCSLKVTRGWERVCIPHSYNAHDGQDGGNDYFRGKATYVRTVARPSVPESYSMFIKFDAVNSCAEVFADGKKIAVHAGGYSAFIVDVTNCFNKATRSFELAVVADNSHNDAVYPQSADFTFYGGMYRDVHLIAVPETHFAYGAYAALPLVFFTKLSEDKKDAVVFCTAHVAHAEKSDAVQFTLFDANGVVAVEAYAPAQEHTETQIFLQDAHVWHGIDDPYLYTVSAKLVRHNEVLDEVSAQLGVREFFVDAEKGFYLNGKRYPLRGVSRHQDMLGKGNALLASDHERDIALLMELGANTVRLAHYQHSEIFYTLCDRAGLVVWAEIPFISVMSAARAAHENCRTQLHELILQNYNHASICFWGIENEITIGGEVAGLYENLVNLNELAKSLDSTRLTTLAQVTMLPPASRLNKITDIISYNHYFGWYFGAMEDNEIWFDKFHAAYPDRAIGISEYGCEGIVSWHSDAPECKDYTEEYQARYHEHMAKIIDERPYLWATHVWNMFDFGCDARDEGGVQGRNNKGLVTFDRAIKKDSFYVYKAYWSKTPFVHIAGRRYAARPYSAMSVKVYSNAHRVALFVNGKKFAEQEGAHIFTFDNVPLENEYTTISAETSGAPRDSVTFRKVASPNQCYVKPPEENDRREHVKNWFADIEKAGVPDFTFNDSFFSVRDTINDIFANSEAEKIVADAVSQFTTMRINTNMLGIMGTVPLERVASMLVQDEEKAQTVLKVLNAELQKIKK